MAVRRKTVGFFVKLIVLYTLFAWPFPAMEAAYSRQFVKWSEALLGVDRNGPPKGIFGTNTIVLMESIYDKDPEHDVSFLIGDKNTGRGTDKPKTSSRHIGYMPAAVLIALVLATPIPWKRRLWALLWGVILVHGFVVVRLAMILAHLLHGDAPYSLFRWDPPWDRVLLMAYDLTSVEPASIYVVSLIIWVAVTFRRDDWDALLSRFQRRVGARR